MSECLTPAGMPNHGPPDPLFAPVRVVVLDAGLLAQITACCIECGKRGPMGLGRWYVVNSLVYCHGCWGAERNT